MIKINHKFLVFLISSGIVFSLSGCRSESEQLPWEASSVSSEGKTDSEEEEFDYFSSDVLELESMIEENQLEEIPNKIKKVVVQGIDFVFYEKEISGVSFDELTEEGKKITLTNLESLTNMADAIVPGWQDGLSENYLVAKEFVKDIYLSSLSHIRQYLGDENYEALGNIKEQISADIGDAYDRTKKHVKSWYEEFRNKE